MLRHYRGAANGYQFGGRRHCAAGSCPHGNSEINLMLSPSTANTPSQRGSLSMTVKSIMDCMMLRPVATLAPSLACCSLWGYRQELYHDGTLLQSGRILKGHKCTWATLEWYTCCFRDPGHPIERQHHGNEGCHVATRRLTLAISAQLQACSEFSARRTFMLFETRR